MCSPKIHEDLIPTLYRLAKARKATMTAMVNALLEKALAETEPHPEGAGGQIPCRHRRGETQRRKPR